MSYRSMKKIGDFPFMEQPDKFLSVILRFLQEGGQVLSQ